MTIADQIYTLVKSLPPDQANEILAFAEFIHAKHINTNQPTDATDSLPWAEFVYLLAGAWKNDFPDLEEIRVELQQDIQRENL